MRSITAKTQYAIAALFDLAERYGSELVQVPDIVRRRNVPEYYIEQILNQLTKAGIVKSVRGNKGGYELAIHPDTLSLLTIIEILEGKKNLQNIQGVTALMEFLEKAEESTRKILDVSISTLLERQKALEQQIVFHI